MLTMLSVRQCRDVDRLGAGLRFLIRIKTRRQPVPVCEIGLHDVESWAKASSKLA
jgi:hypothetical protein